MRDHGRPPVLSQQKPRRGRGTPPTLPLLGVALLVLLAAGLIQLNKQPRTGDGPAASGAPAAATAAAGSATGAVTATAGAESGVIENEVERLAAEEALSAAILAEEQPSAVPATQAPRVRFGPPDPFRQVAVQIQRGESLFQAVLRGGLDRAQANRVVGALGDHVDLRRLRPGDRFEATLWLDRELIEGSFLHGALDRYRLQPEDGQLHTVYDPLPLRAVTETVQGEVRSSLFAAIYDAGERPNLIMAFVDLFSWDFDFGLETRAGDRFEMLVEKRFIEDEFYGYGPILAARYHSGDRHLSACWFDPEGEAAVGGHYHPDGSSVRRAFLRAPLKYTRISSGYTLSRMHPVLHINRPHRGIDYAAPTGTPVYAVGDGTVIGAGRMGGAGLAVRIRHPNGWITSYSHLSRIQVRRGQRVRQGQAVGQVGSTGYSTGPHLDYRIKINGRFVNPLRVDFPRGEPVPAAHRRAFQDQCGTLLARLDSSVKTTVAAAE